MKPNVEVEREGEGYWGRIYAVVNRGSTQEIHLRFQQGCGEISCLGITSHSTDGEDLKRELRDLKALLNAIPEI